MFNLIQTSNFKNYERYLAIFFNHMLASGVYHKVEIGFVQKKVKKYQPHKGVHFII